jgi:hypothetical protein
MKVIFLRSKVLEACSEMLHAPTVSETYHWHLLAFGAGVFIVAETLRHDRVVVESAPK